LGQARLFTLDTLSLLRWEIALQLGSTRYHLTTGIAIAWSKSLREQIVSATHKTAPST
jgi:hypothetical protein